MTDEGGVDTARGDSPALDLSSVKVVLFLGAGASRAEPLNLPTMREFLQRIAPGGDLWKPVQYGRDVLGEAYGGVLRLAGALSLRAGTQLEPRLLQLWRSYAKIRAG